jgi:hypothetical protein
MQPISLKMLFVKKITLKSENIYKVLQISTTVTNSSIHSFYHVGQNLLNASNDTKPCPTSKQKSGNVCLNSFLQVKKHLRTNWFLDLAHRPEI